MWRAIRITAKILLILLALYAIGRLLTVAFGSFYTGERGPYLQLPAPDAVTLRWQTEEMTSARIFYGLSPEHLEYQVEGPISREHEIRLKGLKPASRYYYRIETTNEVLYQGKEYWFRTPPETNAPGHRRLLVLGDPGYAGSRQTEVRDAANDWLHRHPRQGFAPLDFILTTGDNAYRSGTNKQFQAGFFQPYGNWLRNVPVWPAYGNHDARRWAFFKVFTFPQYAQSGGLASHSRQYYSFDYGQLHVVMLDSQSSSMRKGSAMLKWLRSDLKHTSLPWTVVVFHHPPYTKGSHNSDDRYDSRGRMFRVRENVLPILEQSGVDLVLSGHSHMYERSHLMACHYGESAEFNQSMFQKPRRHDGKSIYIKSRSRHSNTGTIYSVVGSSSKLDSGPLNHPAHAVSLRQAGALIVDIKEQQLIARFINAQGQQRDIFSIQKKAVEPFRFSCKN